MPRMCCGAGIAGLVSNRKVRWALSFLLAVGCLSAGYAAATASTSSLPIAAQDRDCSDFDTQAEAQDFYEQAGPGDPHGLDADDDGDANPCPCRGPGEDGGGGGDLTSRAETSRRSARKSFGSSTATPSSFDLWSRPGGRDTRCGS
jgi:hypothetical protein